MGLHLHPALTTITYLLLIVDRLRSKTLGNVVLYEKNRFWHWMLKEVCTSGINSRSVAVGRWSSSTAANPAEWRQPSYHGFSLPVPRLLSGPDNTTQEVMDVKRSCVHAVRGATLMLDFRPTQSDPQHKVVLPICWTELTPLLSPRDSIRWVIQHKFKDSKFSTISTWQKSQQRPWNQ